MLVAVIVVIGSILIGYNIYKIVKIEKRKMARRKYLDECCCRCHGDEE